MGREGTLSRPMVEHGAVGRSYCIYAGGDSRVSAGLPSLRGGALNKELMLVRIRARADRAYLNPQPSTATLKKTILTPASIFCVLFWSYLYLFAVCIHILVGKAAQAYCFSGENCCQPNFCSLKSHDK